jgi:hypothetical protein
MKMADYKLLQNGWIQRNADGASIPPDDGNVDYTTYKEWLNAGNTPDPEDPPPAPSTAIVPRDWLNRLSVDKQNAIAAAGNSNPQIQTWLLKAAGSSTGINVYSQETIDGVTALVTAGVITDADKAILLSPT